MLIQYLIDWDALLGAVSPQQEDALGRDLTRLCAMLETNGALVVSNYTKQCLWKWGDNNKNHLAIPLRPFSNVSHNICIDVDELTGTSSRSMSETLENWGAYVRRAGGFYTRGDTRCRFITDAARAGQSGKWFRTATLADCFDHRRLFRSEADWSRMMHVDARSFCHFQSYLESFVSSSTATLRIYDPYFSKAFESVVPADYRNLPGTTRRKEIGKAANVKRWRDSFRFLLACVTRNEFVNHLEIVTSFQRNKDDNDLLGKYRLNEIIDDVVVPVTQNRKSPLCVSFHFLESQRGREFHDRFMSNGRFCFAIGHGFDMCEVGKKYHSLCDLYERGSMGMLAGQWRNSPDENLVSGQEINVFYGCARWHAPDFCVNREVGCFEKGHSQMYPDNWRARPYGEVASLFDWGDHKPSIEGSVCIPNENPRVVVRINPRDKW